MSGDKKWASYQGSNLQPPILAGDESTDELTGPPRVPIFTNSQVEEIHLKVIPHPHIHKRTQTLTKHLGRTDMIVNNLHLNTDREQTINRQTVNRSCMLINISNKARNQQKL